jgi:hypothetical protein
MTQATPDSSGSSRIIRAKTPSVTTSIRVLAEIRVAGGDEGHERSPALAGAGLEAVLDASLAGLCHAPAVKASDRKVEATFRQIRCEGKEIDRHFASGRALGDRS